MSDVLVQHDTSKNARIFNSATRDLIKNILSTAFLGHYLEYCSYLFNFSIALDVYFATAILIDHNSIHCIQGNLTSEISPSVQEFRAKTGLDDLQ